jgi:hypothetical protein
MKFKNSVVAIALASLIAPSSAFQPNGISLRAAQGQQQIMSMVIAPEAVEETTTSESSDSDGVKALTMDIVKKMRFREVQKELERKELDTGGTFKDMRSRLKELVTDVETEESNETGEAVRVIEEDALNKVSKNLWFDVSLCSIVEDTFSNCLISENYSNACVLHVVIYRRFNRQVSHFKMILIQILILTAWSQTFQLYQKRYIGKKRIED